MPAAVGRKQFSRRLREGRKGAGRNNQTCCGHGGRLPSQVLMQRPCPLMQGTINLWPCILIHSCIFRSFFHWMNLHKHLQFRGLGIQRTKPGFHSRSFLGGWGENKQRRFLLRRRLIQESRQGRAPWTPMITFAAAAYRALFYFLICSFTGSFRYWEPTQWEDTAFRLNSRNSQSQEERQVKKLIKLQDDRFWNNIKQRMFWDCRRKAGVSIIIHGVGRRGSEMTSPREWGLSLNNRNDFPEGMRSESWQERTEKRRRMLGRGEDLQGWERAKSYNAMLGH